MRVAVGEASPPAVPALTPSAPAPRTRRRGGRSLLALTVLGLAVAAVPAVAVDEPVHFDRGAAALEAGRPVPLPNRRLPSRAPRPGALAPPAEAAAPAPYVEPAEFGAFLEFEGTREQLERAGLRVGTQLGRTFTVRLRRDQLAGLRALPGLRRVRLARYARPQLDVSVPEVRAALEHDASGSPPAYDGRAGAGVLIGDVDTGIDFTSDDFRDASGRTRILAIWDQNDDSGSPPDGFEYGSEWTKTQIDMNPGSITHRDADGHGTSVAGVLVGNGAETGCGRPAYRYVGVAPLARFVEVATDLTETGIVDGVNYVFQKAAALGLDCVVNLSLGAQWGPHDGSGSFATAVSALTGPGRVVVASSGNQGGEHIHGRLTTTSRTIGVDRFVVTVPAYTPLAGTGNDYVLVAGWYDLEASVTVRVRGPNPTDTLSCGFGAWAERACPGGTIYIANQSASQGYGGTSTTRQFEVEVYDGGAATPAPGAWEIDVVANSTASLGRRADIWIYDSALGASQTASVTTGFDATTLVAEPADGDSVIAVGAYATKQSWFSCAQGATCGYLVPTALGAIAPFSNPGPRRDGVVRPDLTAPGFGVATTHSTQAGAIGLCGDADDGVHEIQAGTSFSAPHVAGAAALFLESRPGSPPAVVRRSLQAHARTDAHTGAVPNASWGYGKLDVYATIDHAAPAAVLTAPNLGGSWAAGTVHDITWTATDSLGVTAIGLDYSLHGLSGPWVAIAQDLANSGSYPWTVPAVATDSAAVRVVAFDAAGNAGADASDQLFAIVDTTPPVVAPPRLALAPPSPNPGAGPFTLGFTLPGAGQVTLEVFDVGGGRIWSLTLAVPEAGTYQPVWDGRGPSGEPAGSGLYFVRLSSAFGRRSVRLVIVR